MLKLAVSDKEVAFCQFGEHAQISTGRVRSVTLGDRLIAATPPFNLLFLLRKLSFWILLKEEEPERRAYSAIVVRHLSDNLVLLKFSWQIL